MKQCLFSGVCTALVTPFRENGIHYPMVEKLIANQLQAGVRAIVVAGTTGEAPTLTDPEKLQLIATAKAIAGEYCLIIAGTGSNDTAHAIRLSRQAMEAGADALLVVSPYYNKADPQGLVAHYRAICGNVHIPVMAYNVPSRTGLDMSVAAYRALAEIPNLAGVKEACGDISKVAQILAQCPRDFYVWSGNDDQILPIAALGGKGVVSVASNLVPRVMVRLWDAALAGDYREAARLQLGILELCRELFRTVNPVPVKAAMGLLGLDCGPCRLPLTQLPRQELEPLRQALEAAQALI